MTNPIMSYFAYSHLPEKLQAVSKPIGELAEMMDAMLPDGPEKSAGLRKLLEAKDCLVRASLNVELNLSAVQRTILHITVGGSEWDPTVEEINEISRMFQEAKCDPTGSIVTTRYGVNVDVLRVAEDTQLKVVEANVATKKVIGLTSNFNHPLLNSFYSKLSDVVELFYKPAFIPADPVYNSQFFKSEEDAEVYFEKFVVAVSRCGFLYIHTMVLDTVENGLMLQMTLSGVDENLIQGIR